MRWSLERQVTGQAESAGPISRSDFELCRRALGLTLMIPRDALKGLRQ